MIKVRRFTAAILLVLLLAYSEAFVSRYHHHALISPAPAVQLNRCIFRPSSAFEASSSIVKHASLQRQRQSVSQIQLLGLFGLGVPELVVIAIVAAFILGPQKLAELGKDAGKIAGELKEVPKEFQKGLQEGELQAKKLKQAPVGDEVVEAEKENR
jgi:sec-independent protein translocase protein TatA